MAAATIEEIRTGIATNLSAVYGMTVDVSPYQKDAVMPPMIEIVGVQDLTYDTAFGSGLDNIIITISGFPGPINRGAQILMDEWLGRGTNSVKNAIEADPTLGNKVQDTFVISASGQKPMKLPDGTVLLNCEWRVQVLNTGT